MKILQENATRSFESYEDFVDVLKLYEKNDKRVWLSANRLKVFGSSNAPMFYVDAMKEFKDNTPIEDSEEAFIACVNNYGIFLVVPGGRGYEIYPVRYTGYESMLEQSGMSCRTARNIVDKGGVKALDAERRGELINLGFSLSSREVVVYISDEKISYVGSPSYVVLPYYDGVKMTSAALKSIFEDVDYHGAWISHEGVIWESLVSSPETESHRLMLGKALGKRDVAANYIVRFSSSNVGNSKMSVRPMVKIDGMTIPIGKPLSVWHTSKKKVDDVKNLNHDNGCSIEHLQYKLENMLTASLKENEDAIEELGNTVLKHPVGCAQRLLDLCPTIPQRAKKDVLDSLEARFNNANTEALAIDVYLAIGQALEKLGNSERLPVRVQATEEVAQLLALDFKAYDKPKKTDD